MRYSIFVAFIATLQISATGFSQNATINVHLKNAGIVDVFNEIERQSEYKIFYKTANIDKLQTVTINKENIPVDALLNTVLAGRHLSYEMIDKVIVITPVVAQQGISITGTVSDASGELMPGVNVIIKGTTQGVVTDVDGRYSITVPNKDAALVFSFVGYVSEEKIVGQQTTIAIVLQENTQQLEEVIVVGYGVQRKVTSTGSVAKVEGKDLTRLNTVNTEKALQGMSPGITIIDRGGAPGGDNPDIFLRGVGTTGSAGPLVLVDGVEMSLSQVPAQEIENISILKDAASASIYGSRAAHGVILVTTKRGAAGKMKLTYDGYAGFQDRAIKAKGVSAREYMEMVNEANVNAGNSPLFKEDDIIATENGSDPYNHAYIKYPDEIYKTNYITEHNLGISGGNEVGRYMMSFNYLDQPGLTENTSFKRYNYRVNTDVIVGKRMKVSGDLLYRHTDREWPQRLGEAQRSAWSMVPTVPIRYANDAYAVDDQRDNPVASLDKNVVGADTYATDAVAGQIKVDYELVKDLVFTGMASISGFWSRNKVHSKNYKFYNTNDEFVTEWNPQNGVKDKRNDHYQTTLRFLANYKKTFATDHSFSFLYGMEQIAYRNYFASAERKNLISDASPEVSLGNAQNQYAEGKPNENDSDGKPENATLWGINSFFGRVNYAYKDKYLFEANVRADGSSRFAEGDKWGVFPSVSAAWRLSEESFMKGVGFVNSLKVRASWGQTGNERIGEFMYLSQYGVENVIMNGALSTGVRQSKMANPDVTWETVEQTDFGLDFVLMENRIFGEIDYYIKDTKDILLNLAIPKFIGLSAPPQNAGVVRNAGVETMIGYRKMTGEFRFSTTFNFAYNKNKWVDRASDDGNIDGRIIQKEGYALNSYYIFKADGLIANDAELAAYKEKYKSDSRKMEDLKPGDVKFVDTDSNGTIDSEDRMIYAPNIPKFTYGLNFNAEYANFDLNLFFQGATGSYKYIYGEWYEGPSYMAFTGLHFRDRWTPENQNPNASVPRLEAATNRNASTNNSFFMQDNSYLRLKNVQLGYTIPSRLTEKVKIERLRFYLSASNLFTISALDQGLDPETNEGRNTAFPPTKVMCLGVNLTF